MAEMPGMVAHHRGMKKLIWTLTVFAQLSATGLAQVLPDNPQPALPGVSDWNRVQDLANGEGITVARPGELAVPCRFSGATNDALFCDSFYSGTEYRFDRAEVERVRSDDKRRNFAIVVGTLTAAGFIWGVASPPNAGTPRVEGGIAGAALGALAGLVVAVPASILIPGRLVYRHRSNPHQAPVTAASPAQVPDQASPALQ
jgi:hypothetical protein